MSSLAWCRDSRRVVAPFPTLLLPALLLAVMGCQDVQEPPAATGPQPAAAVAAAGVLAFRQVTVGESHTCGVTTADVAYCWGNNGSGQLGTGNETASSTPVPVAGGLAFRNISGEGRFHSCGVTTVRVAYCWGTHNFGQLGNGTEDGSPVPARVAGSLDFRQVSAGILHSCGVTTDNVAYCWGHNQAGELGDGTTNASLVPVRVARNLAFRSVSAGEQLTCGVTTDKVAFCWGDNTYGQLGDGTTQRRLRPRRVEAAG